MAKYQVVILALIMILAGNAVSAEKTSLRKLAENVYVIKYDHYSSLVVLGAKDVLITDPANAFRAGRLREDIANLTNKPVGKIVLSHEHFDHTGGTELFPDAKVIAQVNAESLLKLDPLDLFPDQIHMTFLDRLDIDMGTTKVELHHLGSADGAAAIIVYLPREGIAMVADMYMEDELIPGILMSDTNLLGKREMLNVLVSWNLKHIVESHLETTDPDLAVRASQFHNDLYAAVAPPVQVILRDDPKNLVQRIVELSEVLELPAYRHWKNYRELPEYIKQMAFALVHGG